MFIWGPGSVFKCKTPGIRPESRFWVKGHKCLQVVLTGNVKFEAPELPEMTPKSPPNLSNQTTNFTKLFFLLFDPFLSILGVGFGSHQAEQPYDFVAFSSLSPKAREANIAENTVVLKSVFAPPGPRDRPKVAFWRPKKHSLRSSCSACGPSWPYFRENVC